MIHKHLLTFSTFRSVTIHELGHNLGFRHSGFNSEAYGDESGYMGFTIYQSGGPVKCFNAHKNWVAGWFRPRQYRVNPAMESPVLLRLVTFVDYDKAASNEDVLVKLVGHFGKEYYLQHNVAKSFNLETEQKQNLVTITEKGNGDGSDSVAHCSPQ